MRNIIKCSIWIVAFMLGIDLSFGMISQADTMENIIGFFLLALIFLVSHKTRCFTSIKMRRKNDWGKGKEG